MSKSNWLGHTAQEVNIAKSVDNLLQSRLQGNKICVTDSNSNIKSSSISVSELGHLSGIESNIQVQFDDIADDYQPLIGDGGLGQTKVTNLVSDLSGKQPTIGDDDLDISHTEGLQTELNKLIKFSSTDDGFVPKSGSELSLIHI